MVGLEAPWGAFGKMVGMGDSDRRKKLTKKLGFGECRRQVKPLGFITSVPRFGDHVVPTMEGLFCLTHLSGVSSSIRLQV